MTDGPSRFFRMVRVRVNREQYQELLQYLLKAGDWPETGGSSS
jgi:hypothetical protein